MSLIKAFENVQNDGRKLSFVVKDSKVYVVNALRRLMLSELYCAGIPNQYHKAGAGSHSSGIHMIQNTGRLHNEFLSHRLSMLHLALDPEKWKDYAFVLTLKKDCPGTANDPMFVTSEDIKLYIIRNDNLEREEVEDVVPYLVSGASQLIPTDSVVDELFAGDDVQKGVLLTSLYPGESLEVDMYPMVGRQCDFAGFSPLYTCTYEQLGLEPTPKTHYDFKYSVHGLGSYNPKKLVSQGLQGLCNKLRLTSHMIQPRTVELSFGSEVSSLHNHISSKTRQCWIRWSNVDFLTSLGLPESYYQQHCREVIASTVASDIPLVLKPYSKKVSIPGVDKEDIHNSPEKTKLVLAMHQPTFATNGLYEYNSSKRQYTLVKEKHVAFTIMKEGHCQRAMIYTPATIVQTYSNRCVVQFNSAIDDVIFEHLVQHIDGVVCASAEEGEPPMHLDRPIVGRDPIQLRCHTEKIFTMIVDEEDHTLGNLVQGFIYDSFLAQKAAKNPQSLVAIAYNKPLPSEKKIQFRFEFQKNITEKELVSFFTQQLDTICDKLVEMKKKWDA